MGSHAASQFLLLLWSIISSRPEIRAFYFAVQYSSCIFTRRRIPAVSKKSLPRYFAQTRHAFLSSYREFLARQSQIPSRSFLRSLESQAYLSLTPTCFHLSFVCLQIREENPNSGISLLPFFWFLRSYLISFVFCICGIFDSLEKEIGEGAPIREMITRSKLVEQLREYQIRSEHKWAALVIFSPKPQIITRYFCLCSLNFGYLFGSVYVCLMHSVMRGEELYLSTCREYEFCVNICL